MLRLELRTKNANLFNAIHRDHKSVRGFCRLFEIPYSDTIALMTLKKSPWSVKEPGTLLATAQKIQVALGENAEWLFPPALYASGPIPLLVKEVDMLALDSAEMLALPSGGEGIEERMIRESDEGRFRSVLGSLTPREEEILLHRYGIEGDEMTLDDLGDRLGLTRERVRQIEGKALRKLRHPLRQKMFR